MRQDAANASDLIPGQYIVVFKDQANGLINKNAAQKALRLTQSVLAAHSLNPDSVLFRYKYALKGFAAKLSPGQADKLRKDIRVKRVTQARMFHVGTVGLATAFKNDRVSHSSNVSMKSGQITPWGVTRVGGPLNGTGKKAWIIDSGIDLNHQDLNVDVSNSVSFIANETADDNFGHGTYVAGILAAKDNSKDVVGVAAGATVVSINVCNSSGSCPEPGYLNGIGYVGNHADPDDIVNISIWGPVSTNVDDAVITAANNGVRLVLIAGNAADNANNYSPGRVEHSNIWTVSVFDINDNWYQYSNYGNPPIEYSEPGENIRSLLIGGGSGLGFDGPGSEDGTSYAAPHLAGLLLAEPNNIATDGTVSNDPDNDPDPIGVIPPPPPPLSVYITGPQDVQPNTYPIWTAQPSNGATPYQYDWQERQKPYGGGSWSPWYNFGNHQSEGMTYNYSIYKVELKVTVTDATNETATNTYFAYFNHNNTLAKSPLDSTQTDSAE